MKSLLSKLLILLVYMTIGCNSQKQSNNSSTDKTFTEFENEFLDAYWKQYPSGSINVGYGKYYEKLVIPDSTSFTNNVAFSDKWIDSLNKLDYYQLNDNNKISFDIIKNQLQSDRWYTSIFKIQEWDASIYNISASCDYLINQPYAPLEERLKILSHYLENAEDY